MKGSDTVDTNKFSAVFLTAGNSTRFGRHKAFLRYDDTSTFLEKLLREYDASGIQNIILVVNESTRINAEISVKKTEPETRITWVLNTDPESGRIHSIQLGLKNVPEDHAAFLQNADNPFTTQGMLRDMMALSRPEKFVVPVYQGCKGHPVLLSPDMISLVRKNKRNDANLKLLLPGEAMIACETMQENILANINTMEDYLKYFTHEQRV